MSYKKECLEKFAKFPKSFRDLFGNEFRVAEIDKINQEYNINVDFLVILVVLGELMTYDIDTYIEKRFGLSKEKSQEVASKLNEFIFEPAMFEIMENEDTLDDLFLYMYDKTYGEYQDELSSQQEDPEYISNILPEILSTNILYIFEAKDNVRIAINNLLLRLLENNKNKNQIENLIYSNEEELFDKPFFLKDKQKKSTVSNWIQDYINVVGIDKYDDLALSKFVIDSKNTKNLDQEEKDTLNKILTIYLNIKFFPEIFHDVPVDRWNIIPMEEKKESKIIKKVFVPEMPVKKEKIAMTPKVNSAEELLKEYKVFEKSLSAVNQEVILFGKYKNNLDEFYKEFDEMMRAMQKQRLVAGVIFLAKNKLINIFIKNNKNLFIEFKNFLLLKYDESTVNSISNNLDSIESVSLYLQFLFKKFELSPQETGLYGMYIAKTFKKVGQDKYFPIVYGDTNLNQFLFRDVVDVAGKLKLK